jgi:gentisate 1,2-dioxygenase
LNGHGAFASASTNGKPWVLADTLISNDARSRDTLETPSHNGEPDPCHGYKLRYINPTTGGSPMRTIGTFMALLPGGYAAFSTDGTV